jgi:hypothetical protein
MGTGTYLSRHLLISNSEQSKGTGTFSYIYSYLTADSYKMTGTYSYKQRTKSSLAIDFGLVDKGESMAYKL